MTQPPQLARVLAALGIEALNAMQQEAHRAVVQGQDVVLMAPTGSGKTLGFLVPLLHLLAADRPGVQALVLAPTRELALQIEGVWRSMATGFKASVCYGGHSMATELQSLSQPPALLIGTPGRLADHLSRGSFATDSVRTLVLDEFDKALELGFHDQMAYLVAQLPNLQKRVLVSATAGVAIPDFVRLTTPETLDFTTEQRETGLTLVGVETAGAARNEALTRLLSSLGSEAALIFCNLREEADQLGAFLNRLGYEAAVYHGGLEQDDRERALIRFRNGSVTYLVTTDLAARGLDIPAMKHVVHARLPLHPHEFVHRNGRTARMHASGTAYVLLDPHEARPAYLPDHLPTYRLPAEAGPVRPPAFATIYVSGGKKNKLGKVDIVGFFSQKGGLEKGDLGLIEVKDFSTFAAVRREKVRSLLDNIRDQKLKGKKYKIEIAR